MGRLTTILFLLLVGAWLAAQPLGRSAGVPPQVSQITLTRGEARDVRGRYVQNAIAGPVFVVSGTFVPGAGPPARLRVEWRDAQGGRIPGGVLAGPPLDPAELRERPPAVVRELLAERSAQLAGGGRFDAVFRDVPSRAQGFALLEEELPPPPAPFVGPPWPPPSAGEPQG